ncbi:DegV family protein [Peptoniphilus sp. KCTC 25270]|uniref:DegV family protein n=1 Tax=Peptoniphilus sp. KCTC 25270 TaxID=2897414 RepID=UPI001E3DAF37|nr:DegV family protein [Peptoniphilus sp. KCTC 25270]MCD1147751.1 DegV family protein [Peptoniphilus sp. KCTC 25270]
MKKIAIFGDTSQDLTLDMQEKYGIEILSYQLQMGEEHYKDQVDIQSREFYQRMEEYEVLSTGTPNLQDAIDALDKVKAQGAEEAILITSSGKLTGMVQLYTAMVSSYEGLKLHIFETNQIAASAGLQTIYAAELRDQGKTSEEILQELESIKKEKDASIFALFRTLKYIIKGGRFNKYKGMLGTFLHINPLLQAVDGEVGVIGKARGKKKSLQLLVDEVKKYIGDTKDYRIAIFSGNNDKEVEELQKLLKEEIEKAKMVIVTELTPMLGVHAGPEAIGVSLLRR